jgi:methylated-DNA-[protein]-cysteine S-methyltransferase
MKALKLLKNTALSYDTFETPMGPFSIVVDESGAVVRTVFGNANSLFIYLGKNNARRDAELVAPARDQVLEYLEGKRTTFSVPLAVEKTAFQDAVWKALEGIPYGETCDYQEISRRIGNEKASRAVGRAIGSNPVCVLIPCHRVIGADGSLTGYAFGLPIKRKLLNLEGVRA